MSLNICTTSALILLTVALVASQERLATNTMKNVCNRHWELVYNNDDLGNNTFGDKTLLRTAAMTGSHIKAHLYMMDHILVLSADSLNKRGDELCFQSLKALSHNGSHIDNVNPWLYFMVCTTGDVTERGVNHTAYMKVSIDWYIKEISSDNKPVFTNYIDGSPADPAASVALYEASKHMALKGAMRDRPYIFPLDNVVYDEETGEVCGQNLHHLGQTYRGNYVTFHAVPYQWLSTWSNLGRRDNARWSLQGHRAYKHNQDNTAMDWYADTCWRHVYTNDESGFDLFGTVSELIGYINKGHRVRVRIEDMTTEVSNMRVKDDVVVAQVLNEVSRVGGFGKNKFDIETNTRARFSIVHSTGKVITHEYEIGSVNKKIHPPTMKEVAWMVDTRPWRVVLETEDPAPKGLPEGVHRGSNFDLQDAISQGASIRLNVVLDPLDGSFFTHANNIRMDYMSEDIFAQATDHMSDKKSSQPNEYDFQSQLFKWYLLVSSRGPVRMSAWNYGSDSHRYDESALQAKITWFMNG